MIRAALRGRVGVWSSGLRTAPLAAAAGAAGELEALGFAALWVPGRGAEDIEERLGALLAATDRIVVATGILSIWIHLADDVARMADRLEDRFPGRFLLGLGVSHEPLVAKRGERYDRPVERMADYLDALDRAGPAAGPQRRVLAALAPRMLRLARDRSLGTHPYLVAPAHTAATRAALGPEALVATEQKAVVDPDPAVVRNALSLYFELPNYVRNLERAGLDTRGLPERPSDALIEALVAEGENAIRTRVGEQFAAGADHVAVQLLDLDPMGLPLAAWRRLASILDLGKLPAGR